MPERTHAGATQGSVPRPPVVAVLGHVDHGKTTLLSTIRKTKAPREPGEITQSIGAFEIEIPRGARAVEDPRILQDRGDDSAAGKRRITFIDTPGHEAFSAMRRRGASVADIAILVVAADDGVRQQTQEAVRTVRETGTPFVVAINKVDLPNADVEKVKNQLTAEHVLLEGYGGDVSFQLISAKSGEGIPQLLDLVLLVAEVSGLTFDPAAPATGFILESKMDPRRGISAVAIVQNGTLRLGDPLSAPSATGKVRGLEDALGKRVAEAVPSMPVTILGFERVPPVGEVFTAARTAPGARGTVKPRGVTVLAATGAGETKTINLILRADVSGSLEALTGVVAHLARPSEVSIAIVDAQVGDVSEGDVQLATMSGATIVGFNAKVSAAAQRLAGARGIRVIASDVIYDLTGEIETLVSRLGRQVVKGDLEVLALFGTKEGTQQVIGGKVASGALEKSASFEVVRRSQVLGAARLINLQQNRGDVASVEAGKECGLLIDSEVEVKKGDHIIAR